MSRPAEEIVFEAEYLKLANDDLRELCGLISEAAEALVPASLAMLEVIISPTPEVAAKRVTTAVTDTMAKLKEIQAATIRIGDLVGGRVQALTNEMHGDEDGPADE